jgi:hypothetical protein
LALQPPCGCCIAFTQPQSFHPLRFLRALRPPCGCHSFRRTVKLWRFSSPLPGYNRLAAAASFPPSRKISRLCGSFGDRRDRLAAATSFRQICEALILLNSISRYNRLAAAAPFPLSRKVPRFFDSLCRRHCLSACRAFQTEPARVRALRFSISAERLSRSVVSSSEFVRTLKPGEPTFTNRMLSAATV